jgi:endonuclease YncB( thermonuclease family)
MGDMKGLLRVTGTIDLSQFWPNGDSDVDTANVVVDADGFKFSADASPQALRTTPVFEDAFIGLKPVIGKGRKVTVRIQGIDAPELHCPPGAQHPKAPKQDTPANAKKKKKLPPLKGNGGKFRQFQGETSTAGLAGAVGKATVQCTITTRVNHPNDVFDSHGRLIGDISFRLKNKTVSISHLAAENGWALPSYYNSMNPGEINALQDLFEAARKKKRGIWPEFERKLIKLERVLFEKGGGKFSATQKKDDRKGFVVPKIYRRQLKFDVMELNDLGPASFTDFLAGKPSKGQKNGSKDAWTTRAAILRNPTMKRPTRAPNDSLAGAFSAQKTFPAGTGMTQPGDIVFFEAGSSLKKKKKNTDKGTPITEWFV